MEQRDVDLSYNSTIYYNSQNVSVLSDTTSKIWADFDKD